MPETTNAPPLATRSASPEPAIATITGARMLATTRPKDDATFSNDPSARSIASVKPLVAILARAAMTAFSSLSTANTRPAPRRAATIARMPVPVPRSSTVVPGSTRSSSAVTHNCVVGCRPVPNANPGSISNTTSPGLGS